MSVTERLMLPGDFRFKLRPDTPYFIRNRLNFYGHIVILDSASDMRKLTDAAMLSAARYTGILRRKDTLFDLAGIGLSAYLGDDRGKGAYLEAALTLTVQTFVQSVTALLTAAVPAGTLTAIGVGTWTQTFQSLTNRAALDAVMQYFGGVYRVRPDGKLDAGPPSALFVQTPTAIVTRQGGRDIAIKGLHAPQLDVENDAEDYAPRVWMTGAGGATAGANGPATPYKDLFGNALVMTSPQTSPAGAANLPTIAAAAAAAAATTHQLVTLTSDEYDVPRLVKPGDWLYVWDPVNKLNDAANQVRYRGELATPIKLQVLALTWPVERGMGVYYRDATTTPATYTDLSPYLLPEPPGTTFEVGATYRRLT